MISKSQLGRLLRLAAAFFFVGIAAGTILSLNSPASAEKEFNYKIEKIHASPTQEAAVNFSVPIEVKILAASDDLNWYKVRFSFDFLGHHEVSGWTYIPLGNYIKQNQPQNAVIENAGTPSLEVK